MRISRAEPSGSMVLYLTTTHDSFLTRLDLGCLARWGADIGTLGAELRDVQCIQAG